MSFSMNSSEKLELSDDFFDLSNLFVFSAELIMIEGFAGVSIVLTDDLSCSLDFLVDENRIEIGFICANEKDDDDGGGDDDDLYGLCNSQRLLFSTPLQV